MSVSRVKTGLAGTSGNKGGVALRFTYYNSSLCFVCSHFAAHQGQIKQRNDDFKQIYENTQFPMVGYLFNFIYSVIKIKYISIYSRNFV